MTWQVGVHGWRTLRDAVSASRLFIHHTSDLRMTLICITHVNSFIQLLTECQHFFFYNVVMKCYLLIQELSGIFFNVSLIQVGGEAH